MKRLAIVLTIVPLLVLAACEPAQQQAAEQEVDTLQAMMDDWRMEFENTLADVDVGLDSLEAQAQEIGADLQEEYDSTLSELRERRDSLQQEIDALDPDMEIDIDQVRSDIESGLDDLVSDIEDARRRFREKTGA